MNQVVIKQSYLSYQSKIEVNGYEVGSYSNLSAIENNPFTDIADKIISQLDQEFYDDYTLQYYALPFQYRVLKSFMKDSEYCKDIVLHKMQSLFDVKDINEKFSELFLKYELKSNTSIITKVYVDEETILNPKLRNFEKADLGEAEIAIVVNPDNAMPDNIKTVVIMADEYEFTRNNRCIQFKIPKEDLNYFLEYYFIIEKMIPYFMECMTAFKYIKLDEKDSIMLEAIRTGIARYYIGDIPKMLDKDESVSLEFFSFPENAFEIKTADLGVVCVRDGKICAVDAGNTEILITDNKGEVLQSSEIVVVEHHYVENIRVISDFKYLMKNQKAHLSIFCEPVMAEDANELIWKSSNEKVVHVDNEGRLYALSEGTAIITVSGKKVTESLTVEVKPKLNGIRFLQELISLKNGETTIVDIELDPPNAPTDSLRWEFDNKSIATCNPSKNGMRCQIIASTQYTGSGNLRCIDDENNVSAVAPVIVQMPSSVPGGGCGGCLLAVLGFIVLIMIFGSL